MEKTLLENPEDIQEEEKWARFKKEENKLEEFVSGKINARAILEKFRKISSLPIDEETIGAMAKLAYRLKDKLADYDTVISDDASGRLPSRFMRELINKKRKEAGKDGSDIYFIAAGRGDVGFRGREKAIKKFLKETEKKKPLGKTLVMTEYIASGQGIAGLTDLMEKGGVDFDVASVSIDELPDYYEQNVELDSLSKRLTFGSVGYHGLLSFYGKSLYSGVVKDDNLSSAHPAREKDVNQKDVNAAREGMKMLARELEPLLE